MVETTYTPVQAAGASKRAGELVRSVYLAYVEGRLRPTDKSVDASRRDFLASMEAQATSRLSRRELLFTSRCKGYCDESRKAAVQNDVASACRWLSAAGLFANSRQIGAEARLLCRSEIAPAEAYLDYCCGDFHQSRKRIFESLEIDQELEERYGYGGTHAHRVHLLSRLVRVEERISGLPQAMRLAAEALRYMSGTANTVPAPGAWGPAYASSLPPGLFHFLAVQLIYEIADILAGTDSKGIREALDLLLGALTFEAGECFWNSRVRSWMELKSLSTRDHAAYLECCAGYLAGTADRIPALWYTAALDAALVCQALRPGEALPLKREVVSDMSKLSYLPPRLRQRISRMRMELSRAPGTA